MTPSQAFVDELVALVVERLAPAISSELATTLEMRTSLQSEPWRLLDLEEAAQRLGRSTRWIRERVKRGELASVRLDGGALAFDLDDLHAFAAARRIGGEARQEMETTPQRRLRAVDRGWFERPG